MRSLFCFTGEEKIKAEMDSVFVKFEVHKNVGHLSKKKNIKLNLQNGVRIQIFTFNENINHNTSLIFINLANRKHHIFHQIMA